MRVVVVGFLIGAALNVVRAEYTVGELVDGLTAVTTHLDSRADMETGARKACKALDYLGGSYEATLSIARLTRYPSSSAPAFERLYDYDLIPGSLDSLMRDVITYYHQLRMLRDENAGDFLLSFYLMNYGATEKIREQSGVVIQNMVVASAVRFACYPGKPNALADWVAERERKESRLSDKEAAHDVIFQIAQKAFSEAHRLVKEKRKAERRAGK